MTLSFANLFFLIYIISNIFSGSYCENITCEKIILNKNGIIRHNSSIITVINATKKNAMVFSIDKREEFIIFNCYNKSKNDSDDCMYYYGDNYNDSPNNELEAPSPSFCRRRNTANKNNICCHYREKKIITNDIKTISRCLELNKYEIERFKWIISDNTFNNFNTSNNSVMHEICCA